MKKKFLIVTLIILGFNSYLFAKPYEKLRGDYFLLRNRDYKLEKSDKWEKLIHKYNLWIKNESKSKDSKKIEIASFHLAKIHCDLEEKEIFLKNSRSCIRQLKDFVIKFNKSDFVDDALIKLAKVYEKKRDLEEAKKHLEIILADFKNSDMADLAKLKLEILNTGKSFKSLNQDIDKSLPLIVIDPGHGGEDLGAVGKGGMYEKDVVLAISYELKKMLQKRKIANVFLTRTKDAFIPLAKRTEIANKLKADLFLSIHVNASTTKRNSGLEIYYLDNKFGEASTKLAERENKSVNFEGVQKDVYLMLADLIQDTKKKESIELAKVLEKTILEEVNKDNYELKSLGVRKAPFYVLIGAHMPCLLLELFYIDHKKDGILLSQKSFRKKVATGIFNGVSSYFKKQK